MFLPISKKTLKRHTDNILSVWRFFELHKNLFICVTIYSFMTSNISERGMLFSAALFNTLDKSLISDES